MGKPMEELLKITKYSTKLGEEPMELFTRPGD
jgi:hypothetical protein